MDTTSQAILVARALRSQAPRPRARLLCKPRRSSSDDHLGRRRHQPGQSRGASSLFLAPFSPRSSRCSLRPFSVCRDSGRRSRAPRRLRFLHQVYFTSPPGATHIAVFAAGDLPCPTPWMAAAPGVTRNLLVGVIPRVSVARAPPLPLELLQSARLRCPVKFLKPPLPATASCIASRSRLP